MTEKVVVGSFVDAAFVVDVAVVVSVAVAVAASVAVVLSVAVVVSVVAVVRVAGAVAPRVAVVLSFAVVVSVVVFVIVTEIVVDVADGDIVDREVEEGEEKKIVFHFQLFCKHKNETATRHVTSSGSVFQKLFLPFRWSIVECPLV